MCCITLMNVRLFIIWKIGNGVSQWTHTNMKISTEDEYCHNPVWLPAGLRPEDIDVLLLVNTCRLWRTQQEDVAWLVMTTEMKISVALLCMKTHRNAHFKWILLCQAKGPERIKLSKQFSFNEKEQPACNKFHRRISVQIQNIFKWINGQLKSLPGSKKNQLFEWVNKQLKSISKAHLCACNFTMLPLINFLLLLMMII